MKRAVVAAGVAAAVVLGIEGRACASIQPAPQTVCTDGAPVVELTMPNPFSFDAVMHVWDATVDLPAYTTTGFSHAYTGPTVPYTIDFDTDGDGAFDDYHQAGVLDVAAVLDCVPATTTSVVVTLPPVTTVPPPVTAAPAAPTPAAPSQPELGEPSRQLAFTGDHTDAALILGLGLIAGGFIAVAYERARRS